MGLIRDKSLFEELFWFTSHRVMSTRGIGTRFVSILARWNAIEKHSTCAENNEGQNGRSGKCCRLQ